MISQDSGAPRRELPAYPYLLRQEIDNLFNRVVQYRAEYPRNLLARKLARARVDRVVAVGIIRHWIVVVVDKAQLWVRKRSQLTIDFDLAGHPHNLAGVKSVNIIG
jgi:hypothetical protein